MNGGRSRGINIKKKKERIKAPGFSGVTDEATGAGWAHEYSARACNHRGALWRPALGVLTGGVLKNGHRLTDFSPPQKKTGRAKRDAPPRDQAHAAAQPVKNKLKYIKGCDII